MESESLAGKVALITGGARRLGAAIAAELHEAGMRVIIHYWRSRLEAEQLARNLNAKRSESAMTFQFDLRAPRAPEILVAEAISKARRLDVLVNNASVYYSTPVGQFRDSAWQDLVGINLKVPLWLMEAAAPKLRDVHGSIINLVDVHAARPRRGYAIYAAAKGGLVAATRCLARELAPEVRVNAVAPGAALWPEPAPLADEQARLLSAIPMGTLVGAAAIARAVHYLARDRALTGVVLPVDGGQSIGWAY